MSEYNGPLHEMTVTTPTRYWNDSCSVQELAYAIERGAIGATSNPVIVLTVLKQEMPLWNGRILQVIRAVDAQLGNSAPVQRASTDANIPLSMGREAIAIGGGGIGGGAHTLQEWFDCSGRELGLKRILLALLALAGVSA